MSSHNGPRLNAIMTVLKRKDLSQEEKDKRIKKINDSFDKHFSEK